MMARTTTMVRFLLATLILLLLFTGINAQAQSTRATVAAQPDAARVPPPGDDDPPQPPFNAATPINQSVPGSMTAGGVYTVTINMKNTGNTTWTSGTAYSLGSRNPFDNATWGGGRVGLPGDIPPGGFAQFTFQVTAPAAAGSYNFQWGMVQDGVEWFGTPSDNLVINVVPPPRVNNAQFSSQSVPNSMTAGQAYTVTVVMLNTGNTTWNAHGDIGLASANPLANNTWNAVRIDLPTTTSPGQTASSTFQIVAPNTPGTYNFQWNMVQDGIEWFGTPSSNVAVAVSAPAPLNASQIIGMTVPTLTAGQVANISVTLQNTGNTTWPAGSNYKLGSKNPDENMIWGVQRVDLASNVAPGQQYTFTFPITAPAAGTYTMQWQMMQRYVEWFGGLASTSVTVGAPAGDTVTYIHTDALGSPVARSDSAGNVISRTSYEPYGRTASGVTPTIGFTGHVNDADTGLVYMQQRYYDPVAGRFISTDPVLTDTNTGGAFNRYLYANGNPYKFVDPDGRFAVFIHWGITFAASLRSGNKLGESISYANRAWRADTEEGSQGYSAEAVARHAMRNDEQTVEEARINNAKFVAKAVADGDLGLAAHASQDRYAHSHEGFQVWKGFKELGIIGTLKHILADSFPSPGRIETAFRETVKVFESSKANANTKNDTNNPENSNNSHSGDNFSPAGCMAPGGDCWH